ncbi:MAG: MmcB family DNA repair protein [Thermaurantiacus tibetensis]|uniref:MmcB family DNA repair protein n=1 Tax=Thermaurantiacus tibetensis TaxID=2759035 RepID=UPI002E2E0C0C|nr:MmcB family DNA repair protein [Thermaurantiacus tibetensis]
MQGPQPLPAAPSRPDPQGLTAGITRGVCRLFWLSGFAPVREVTLANGRRADVLGVNPKGTLWIAEVKTSRADLLGDCKWPAYRDFCDAFLWAVPEDLAPLLDAPAFLPEEAGLVVADAHGAALVRPPVARPLAAARRRAVTLALARTAAERAHRLADPGFEGFAAR